MHPILFEIPKIDLGGWTIGPIPIRLDGLMIGIGFLVALWLASRRAKKEGIDPDRILDMGVYLLLAAIVGSRLLYVLVNLQEFQRNWLDVFAIWKGGLVLYGGLGPQHESSLHPRPGGSYSEGSATMSSVVVVGAGISGLSAAFWLSREGVDVIVLEADSHAGGTMRTIYDDGWLIEAGTEQRSRNDTSVPGNV